MTFSFSKVEDTNNRGASVPTIPTMQAVPAAPLNSVHTVAQEKGVTGNEDASFSLDMEQYNKSQLDEKLAKVIGKDYPKIKAEIDRICAELGLRAPKNNTIIDDTKINEIVKNVEKVVKYLKDNHLEINAENLFKGICYIRDTNILEKNGISRKEYEELVKNGEAIALRELLGLEENEEITEAKVAKFAQKVVNELMEKVKSSPNPEQAMKEAMAEQKKQFAICLVATPVEDRAKLFGAIEHAFVENRAEFINEIFMSLSAEERLEFANQIGIDRMNKILNTPDANGNTFAIDEKTGLISMIVKNQGEEAIRANEEQLMNEAREFFAKPEVLAVMAKIKNKEELTEEEQKIAQQIDTYTAISAGGQGGVADSGVLSEESKNELLKLLQHDSYELPNYRYVVRQLVTLGESGKLSISKEQFAELMDKVSNGNYSTVAGDMEHERQTGEVRESALNAPKDPNATSNADLGFKTEGTGSYATVDALTAQIVEQSRVEEQNYEIVKNNNNNDTKKTYTRSELSKLTLAQFAKKGSEAIKFYIDTFGVETFIENAITGNVGKGVLDKAEALYTNTYNANQQVEKAENASSYKIGKTYLSWLPDSIKERMSKMTSFALTQELKQEQDEAKAS